MDFFKFIYVKITDGQLVVRSIDVVLYSLKLDSFIYPKTVNKKKINHAQKNSNITTNNLSVVHNIPEIFPVTPFVVDTCMYPFLCTYISFVRHSWKQDLLFTLCMEHISSTHSSSKKFYLLVLCHVYHFIKPLYEQH